MKLLDYPSPCFIKNGKHIVNKDEKLQVTVTNNNVVQSLHEWLVLELTDDPSPSWKWIFGVFKFLRFVVVHFYARAADYTVEYTFIDNVLTIRYTAPEEHNNRNNRVGPTQPTE